MAKKARPHKTFHISVPESDWEIMEWLSKQYNQSSSVRELIRSACREYGMVDLFVGSPAQRTPGVRGRVKQPGTAGRETAQGIFSQSLQDNSEAHQPSTADEQKTTVHSETPSAERSAKKARDPDDKAEESIDTARKGGIRMDASVLDFSSTPDRKPTQTHKTPPDKKAMDDLKNMMDV